MARPCIPALKCRLKEISQRNELEKSRERVSTEPQDARRGAIASAQTAYQPAYGNMLRTTARPMFNMQLLKHVGKAGGHNKACRILLPETPSFP